MFDFIVESSGVLIASVQILMHSLTYLSVFLLNTKSMFYLVRRTNERKPHWEIALIYSSLLKSHIRTSTLLNSTEITLTSI